MIVHLVEQRSMVQDVIFVSIQHREGELSISSNGWLALSQIEHIYKQN